MNSERLAQLLKQSVSLPRSWRILRSITLEKLEFKLEKIIGGQKPTKKSQKSLGMKEKGEKATKARYVCMLGDSGFF